MIDPKSINDSGALPLPDSNRDNQVHVAPDTAIVEIVKEEPVPVVAPAADAQYAPQKMDP